MSENELIKKYWRVTRKIYHKFKEKVPQYLLDEVESAILESLLKYVRKKQEHDVRSMYTDIYNDVIDRLRVVTHFRRKNKLKKVENNKALEYLSYNENIENRKDSFKYFLDNLQLWQDEKEILWKYYYEKKDSVVISKELKVDPSRILYLIRKITSSLKDSHSKDELLELVY